MIKNLLIYMMLLLLICGYSFGGDNERLGIRLLSVDAGAPEDPQNIKLVMQLPQVYRGHNFTSNEVLFFVYPKKLTAAQGAVKKYLARGEIFWRRGDLLFADIRQLPKQVSAGEYNVLGVIVDKKVNKVAYSAVASGTVIYESPDVDVALVIDCSQSMAKNDPHKKRIAAAKAFIEMATRHGRINSVGVVKFNDKATLVSPFMPLITSTDTLKKKLDTIGSSGQTNIGLAFESVTEMTEQRRNKRAAVIFLTDGKNESVAYDDQHLKLAANDIPVYCIGLSEDADMDMLKRVAAETGGRAYQAANYRELMSLYQRIAAEIGQRKEITTRAVFKPDETIDIPVDATVKNISITIDAGLDSCNVQVFSPKGLLSGSNYSSPDYQQLRIDNPVSGNWKIKISKKQELAVVNVVVSADTSMFIDTFPLIDNGKEYLLAATLADMHTKVGGSNIRLLSIEDMNGVVFNDDGVHYDGAAGDGLYVAVLPKNKDFKRRLILAASGEYKGSYLRQTDAGVLVCDKAAYIKPMTVMDREIDFGSVYPGGSASVDYRITHQGAGSNVAISFTEFAGAGGAKLASSNVKYEKTYNLKDGINSLPISIDVGGDACSGEYKAFALINENGKQKKIPATITVKGYGLKTLKNSISTGLLLPGEKLRFKIPVIFDAAKPLKPIVGADKNWLNIKQLSGLLQPRREQVLDLSADIAAELKPGPYKVRLYVGLGSERKEIELSFEIPKPGFVQQSLVTAHELKIPQAGASEKVVSFVHEAAIPPVMAIVLPVKEKKVRAATAPVMPAQSFAPVQDEFPLPMVLIVAAVALAVVLLILRNMFTGRGVRFLLLSIAIHLPLIAFLAVYVMSVNDSGIEHEKTQTMAVALADESGIKSSAQGSKDDNGILKDTAGVAVDSESRFKSKGNYRSVKSFENQSRKSAIKRVKADAKIKIDSGAANELERTAARADIIKRGDMPAMPRNAPVVKPEVQVAPSVKTQSKKISKHEQVNPAQHKRFAPDREVVRRSVVERNSKHVPGLPMQAGGVVDRPVVVSEKVMAVKPKVSAGHGKSAQPSEAMNLPVAGIEKIKVRAAPSAAAPLLRTTGIDSKVVNKNNRLREDYHATAKVFSQKPATEFAADSAESVNRDYTKSVDRDYPAPVAGEQKFSRQSVVIKKKTAITGKGVGAREIVAQIPDVRGRLSKREVKADELQAPQVGRVVSAVNDDIELPSFAGTGALVKGKRKTGEAYQADNSKPGLRAEVGDKVRAYSASVKGSERKLAHERFGEGGYSAMAMSAPEGGVSRIERTSITFSHSRAQPRRSGDEIEAIFKSSMENSGSSDVVSSRASDVCIRVGVVGELDFDLPAPGLENVSLAEIRVELEQSAVEDCQVLIVPEGKLLSSDDKRVLAGYVMGGGKLWLAERSDLLSLRESIEDYCSDENGLSRCRYSTQNDLEMIAGGKGMAVVSLLSRSGAKDKSVQVMNKFFNTDLFAGSNKPGDIKTIMWQDYSALARGKHGWLAANWGDAAKIGLVPDGSGGMSMLVSVDQSVRKKTGIYYAVPDYKERRLDLGKYASALIDLYSASDMPIKVSVLFTCFSANKGWDEYETKPVTLKKGWNRNLRFELTNLLSRSAGRSAYDADMKGANQCARVTLLFRCADKMKVLVDNFRWAY